MVASANESSGSSVEFPIYSWTIRPFMMGYSRETYVKYFVPFSWSIATTEVLKEQPLMISAMEKSGSVRFTKKIS